MEVKTQIIIAAVAILVGITAIILIIKLAKYIRRNERNKYLDEMPGLDFEYYCADLLKQRGFIDVEVTKSSGDYGIDILAEKEGVTYAIQCKRYQEPVGFLLYQV